VTRVSEEYYSRQTSKFLKLQGAVPEIIRIP